MNRLKGKEQEEALKNLDEIGKKLEETTKKYGLPWED